MRKAYFLFLLLITLTGCSDTMAYSPAASRRWQDVSFALRASGNKIFSTKKIA